jgi:hypothetical protein
MIAARREHMMRKSLICAFWAVAGLGGCAVSNDIAQGEVRYIRELDYVVDGTPHKIRRAVTCVPVARSLSAADGKFHITWGIQEERSMAVDLGGGLLLAFNSSVDCGRYASAGPRGWATLVDANYRPARVTGIWNDRVERIGNRTIQVTRSGQRQLASSDREGDLTPETALIAKPGLGENHISIWGKALVIPQETWTKIPEAAEYFGQLRELTVGPRNEKGNAAFSVLESALAYEGAFEGAASCYGVPLVGTDMVFSASEQATKVSRARDCIPPYFYLIEVDEEPCELCAHGRISGDVVYDGHKFPKAQTTQIYDPRTRNVIVFSGAFLPL